MTFSMAYLPSQTDVGPEIIAPKKSKNANVNHDILFAPAYA
ncbi:MAG: hypothetical protein AAF517_25400 [Planctomycetota bacterium]